MDWGHKAVLTAAMVALLLIGGRAFGRRFAGALAGLPTVTGPALIWLAMEFGADYVLASPPLIAAAVAMHQQVCTGSRRCGASCAAMSPACSAARRSASASRCSSRRSASSRRQRQRMGKPGMGEVEVSVSLTPDEGGSYWHRGTLALTALSGLIEKVTIGGQTVKIDNFCATW